MHSLHRNVASVSPCSTPVVISKTVVSPSYDLIMERVVLYRINMAL